MGKSPLNSIKIVLNQTSHPGNIGAAARAMKTMGLRDLILVNPKTSLDTVAYARASGATDILDSAVITRNLDIALSESQIVIATSARQRNIKIPTFNPKEAALRINESLNSGLKVALLFGNEQHGLSNLELQKCQEQIIIPTSNEYSSLNLATAVQLICYEIFCANNISNKETITKCDDRASSDEIERLFTHIISTLRHIDYLEDKRSTKISQKLRVILHKYELTTSQVQILRGVLTQIDKRTYKRTNV